MIGMKQSATGASRRTVAANIGNAALEQLRKSAAPIVLGVLLLAAWEAIVRVRDIQPYVLPAPSMIAVAMVHDWGMLSLSLWTTLSITLQALALAVVVGLALSVLFAQSAWMERAFFPYAVVLQVTPVVAIAPLIIIWAHNSTAALLICAWLVAFFPILSNTTLGLNSADHHLVDLFTLYRANRRQTLRYLRLPAAMPYFLAGLRISGGLALIGAVVAEFVAGSGGTKAGLAFRILEAGNQLDIPRMFAALGLISLCGIAIFIVLTIVSHLALRHWHESAVRRES
jgi:NitT/TauT family transport system permease protein